MSPEDPPKTSRPGVETAAALEIVEELLEGWRRSCQGQIALRQRGRKPHRGRLLAIRSLAAHAHTMGRTAVPLLASNRAFEAMPLLRTAFECAITAIWLAQAEDGGNAIVNEFARSRRAVAQTLKQAESAILQDGAEEVFGAEDRARLNTTSDNQARQFWQMCHDLVGGRDLYVYYRILSEFGHASVRVMEHYLVANDDFDDVRAIRYEPEPIDPAVWAVMLGWSLIWAGTAADYIDETHARRRELREVAPRLGIKRDLHLTPEAQLRTRTGSRLQQPESSRPPT